MIVLKAVKKVDINQEIQNFALENSNQVIGMNILIENKNVTGKEIEKISDFDDNQVIFSRLMHNQQIVLPHNNTVLQVGDIIRAVGPKENIEKLCKLLGSKSNVQLEQIESDITGRRMVVTNQKAVGKTIQELNLRQSFRVTATRISHDDLELPASNNIKLYYGDSLWIVGEPDNLEKFSKFIGDSQSALNHPFILPVFVGMLLGIIVGQIPIQLPGLPSPVKIGLAGGPLIVAILASRLGRFGHVIWYLPTSANHVMRKFGISLFLACVGLKSGAHFIQTVMTPQGLVWFLWGCVITIIPLLIVGSIALFKFRINYLTVCGLMAGSLTDPPALVFANNLANCTAQSVAYSTVYPLVMILRIITIQILVIIISMH
jgi:putative transport protein